jgi:S1 RNA binding domain protein
MQLEVGAIVDGKVTGITKFGAFIELPDKKTGMVHISEVAPTFVKDINDYVKMDQEVKVKVLGISPEGKISLSMKRVNPPAKKGSGARPDNFEWKPKRNDNMSFEEMMTKFKQSSDEKLLDLKKYIDPKRGNVSKRAQSK